jgi:hypothetical protein
VRGPKRAAARRLIQGMVATSAAVALLAPAAGASTVTNTHDPTVTDAPVSYTDDTGEANNLTLTSDGTTLSFAESVSVINSGVGGLDEVEDCLTSATTTASCPAASTTVNLGDGDDTLALGAGLPSLTVIGGAGTDRLDFASRTDAVSVTLGGATPGLAVNTVENVTGGDGGDTIAGDASRNIENGGGGNDALIGNDGNDELSGGTGVNNLTGGNGDDTLTAGNSGDLLDGGAGVDTFTGGDGSDTIVAADGLVDGPIDCGNGTDTVVADLGPAGPVDTFLNCESVQGTVRTNPTPQSDGNPPDPLQPIIILPGGSIKPVLGPGKADIADLIPPRASMRSVSRHRIATILKRGVPVRVTCRESCGISVAISVDRTAAKRLKLDARTSPVVIGTATAIRTLAGSSVLRVKLTKKAKAAFKKSKRSVVSNTQVLVSDASGNGTLLQRHITLVR